MVDTAATIFAQAGGQLRFAAQFARAAYHLSSSEIAAAGYNITDSGDDAAFNAIGNAVTWLTSADLPALASSPTGDVHFPTQGLTGGIYTNLNAAAAVARSSDALFISFRGTNDTASLSDFVFGTPDNNQWGDPAQHYALLASFVAAIDAYVANGITKVYVYGHSLGGAMVQEFMRAHAGAQYEGISFASIGSELTADSADDRLTNVWINNDIALTRYYLQHEYIGDQNFADGGLSTFSGLSIHSISTYTHLADFLGQNGVVLENLRTANGLDIDNVLFKVASLDPANNVFDFGTGNDRLTGTNLSEILVGGLGADILDARGGQDYLTAGAGADILNGGLGRDTLRGGANADQFDFNTISDSAATAARDVILDFQRNLDDIDLRGIDAKTGIGFGLTGDQAFRFIGLQAFHFAKGEVHYKLAAGGGVIVEGDINGDARADFSILVKNVGALAAGDFLL